MKEQDIEEQLRRLERISGKHDTVFLQKKLDVVTKERDSLKQQNQLLKKELAVYRQAAIQRQDSTSRQILELQHQKIVELQRKAEEYRSKYEKTLNSSTSFKQTEHAIKYRQLDKQHRETVRALEKEVAELKERLMRYSAKQMIQSRKSVLAPVEATEIGNSLLFKYRKVGGNP